MTNREQITKAIKKFGLHADDVYVHKTEKFKIIKRSGYKRIQSVSDITIRFQCPHAGVDFAVVIAAGMMPRPKVKGQQQGCIHRQTLGEANPLNNSFPYPVNVAQKRAEGRLILEMANLYEEGFMTEDEIDETVKQSKLIKKMEEGSKGSVDNASRRMGLQPHKND